MRRDNNRVISRLSDFNNWHDTITYLETTIRNIDQVARPTNPEFFSLNHNDLGGGFNVMVHGSKVIGLIDWETGSYDPPSLCVQDLTDVTDFDPREWRAHAGPNGVNFNVLPYRLEDEDRERLNNRATQLGAERKPFPDWDIIENNGGPLGEEDFFAEDYPEDLSSGDDESIIDSAEMHCDSDVEAEEACVLPGNNTNNTPQERLRRGLDANELWDTWYLEPVFALMREFIHRNPGAGLGPSGEWGRLPEEYSRPLALWTDTLFQRTTGDAFYGMHLQLIRNQRDDGHGTAKGPGAKKSKTQPRQRRVPTLMDGWRDASAAAGTEIPSESPPPRRVNWSAGFAPKRIRLNPPPMPYRAAEYPKPITRRARRNPNPVQLSPYQRARAPTGQKKKRGMGDPRPVKPPPAGFRVQAVRDKVTAKIIEQLMARLRRKAEAEAP